MMKMIRSVLAWVLVLTFASGALWADRQFTTVAERWAEPRDSLAEAQGGRSPFRLMSRRQVEEIFKEHLRAYPADQATALAHHLIEVCERHALKPALVLALIRAESSFRTNAVSHRGAVGLMQIMPDTARYISERWGIPFQGTKELFDPYKNISLGVTYLAYLRDKYSGSLQHMLAAYNIGPGRVDKLIAANRFRVVKTKPYIDSIREGVILFRDFGRGVLDPWIEPMLEAMDTSLPLTSNTREPNV